jgi:hypothetical protein
MKKNTIIPAFIFLTLMFLAGCENLTLTGPDSPKADPGHGMVLISLAGVNVLPSPDARTMLPQNPEFTRYELKFFTDITGDYPSTMGPYSFTKSITQLQLPVDIYYIRANGYNDNGEVPAARSDIVTVTVTVASLTPADFKLEPYIEPDVNGILNFSLSWDSLARMPARAELFIEQYGDHDGNSLTDETWESLAPSYIPQELRQTGPGTILLVNKAAAFINLNGSLSLSPGEYRLTMTLTMDEGVSEVSRFDIAHVYSNLTTPAAFHYGGGDFLLSNASPDPGAAFITGFTFTETPNATTVIGSQPGADGTRLIMIMVPDKKVDGVTPLDLADLTPVVVCADGSSITSPLPSNRSSYTHGEIDFTNPTVWTAQARNGAVQKYTVVVSKAPNTSAEKQIIYFFFQDRTDLLNIKNYADHPGIIDESGSTIHVILPNGTAVNNLYPIISILGKGVSRRDGSMDVAVGAFDFSSAYTGGTSVTYRVYAEDATSRDYAVTVDVAPSTEKQITKFVIDGYPSVYVTIDEGQETITGKLPYGVSLDRLTPLVQYIGKKLEPLSGTMQNFSAPVYYTVTAGNNSQKTYQVTLTNEEAEKNTGIFDFVITQLIVNEIPADPPNHPYVSAKTYTGNTPAKVVIGQKPRADGKIPIVIQVPFNTDEKRLIPTITLSSASSTISPAPPITVPLPGAIPFGNAGNPKEAVYRVSSQGNAAYQDYVVVVSMGGQYFYVNGDTGSDTEPDYYHGMTEDRPFRTLAHAVEEASKLGSGIDHIFISGELNAGNQTDGGDSNSVIAIDGTEGKTITVTGMGGGATFRGDTNKRVLSVTGGADLVFENITVTGGNVSVIDSGVGTESGNGGGIYIGGNSKVKFSGGSITGNTATSPTSSGGGVYVEGSTDGNINTLSEFTLENASIIGNTALGTSTTLASLAGGGGVCVSGDALFWMASGTIANNTAGKKTGNTYSGGSGGGVLVRGTLFDTTYDKSYDNLGFLMSGGTISGNNSYGNSSPHGGGGVYVASGEFDMQGGSITSNYSKRQGGGIFVHSGAVFNASGYSSITGNDGVGSSKGLCSRGVTEFMGNAQADTIYVWNPLAIDAEGNQEDYNSFTLGENARVGGIVLAYSAEYRNYIILADNPIGTGQIGIIDLESHLNASGSFAGQLEPDWLGQTIITGNNTTLKKVLGITPSGLSRLPLNSFTGQPSVYNLGTNYIINVAGSANVGTFARKP